MVSAPTDPAKRALWRRLGGHGEVAMWTAAMLLLTKPLGLPPGFFGLQPSPLWFVILWGGLRGGLSPALLAATLVSSLHAIGALEASRNDLAVLLAPATTWTMFAFFVVAWFVGQARDLLGDDLRHAREARDDLQRQLAEHVVDRDVLATANRELKRRVFDRSLEFDSLLAAAVERRPDGDESLFEAPLQMLTEACGATRCSALLVFPDGSLDLAAHVGWTMGEIRPRVAAAGRSARVRAAITSGRPLLDFAAADVGEVGPLWLAPIADATGVIKAVLCVDEIAPVRCDEPTRQAFLGVASWFTASMRRLQLQDATRASVHELLAGLEAHRHVGSPAELAERLWLDDARRQRYGIDTALLAIRSRDPRVLDALLLRELEQELAGLLATTVRATDDLFHFGFPGCYVLALTGCKSGDIEQLVTRLRGRFNATGSALLAGLELLPMVPGGDAGADLAALLPSLQAHFTSDAVVPCDHRCPVPTPRPQRRGNAADFARRLRLELELARRLSAEVHLVEFSHPDPAVAAGPMIARHLWNAVGTLLRATDGIYVLEPERCAVLLPFTTCLDASRVQERLREAIGRTIPVAQHEGIEVRFLSLADADARQTLLYLMPTALAAPAAADAPSSEPVADAAPATAAVEAKAATPREPAVRQGPVVTESELQELAFSTTEFEKMHREQASLAAEFNVLRASGVETALPSPDAIRKRWEEVFGPDPKAMPKSEVEAAAALESSAAAPLLEPMRIVPVSPLAPDATAPDAVATPIASVPPAATPPVAPAAHPNPAVPAAQPAAGAAPVVVIEPTLAAAVELVLGVVVRTMLGVRPEIATRVVDDSIAAAEAAVGRAMPEVPPTSDVVPADVAAVVAESAPAAPPVVAAAEAVGAVAESEPASSSLESDAVPAELEVVAIASVPTPPASANGTAGPTAGGAAVAECCEAPPTACASANHPAPMLSALPALASLLPSPDAGEAPPVEALVARLRRQCLQIHDQLAQRRHDREAP